MRILPWRKTPRLGKLLALKATPSFCCCITFPSREMWSPMYRDGDINPSSQSGWPFSGFAPICVSASRISAFVTWVFFSTLSSGFVWMVLSYPRPVSPAFPPHFPFLCFLWPFPACWWCDVAGCCWCAAGLDPGYWALDHGRPIRDPPFTAV